MSKRKRAALGVILFASLAIGSAALGLDQYGLSTSEEGSWDAILVAGCRVNPDGEPSLSLKRRAEAAVRLYEQGSAKKVIFTGGIGEYPPSEAAAAAGWARSLGLPDSAIQLEEVSTSTEGNAKNASEQYQLESVIVVTDSYHVYRCERVFGRYFSQVAVHGVRPPAWPRVRGSIRELAAVALYAVKGKL